MELNKHWKPLAEAVAHEKNLPVERIVAALGAALASLTLRKNPRPGTCKVEGLLDNQPQAWFQPEGEDHWEPMELPALTRTAAQWVKQALYQNLRQELREQAFAAWKHREGELVRGVVKRSDFQRIQVDLGNGTEGVLLREDRLAGDLPKPGQALMAVVSQVSLEGSGPVVRLSRSNETFVQALLEREVPEVAEGLVRVRAIARRAGHQTKVALEAGTGFRGDPVGACVGMRGVRIQAVTRELGNERLELLQWHENVAETLSAALGPGVERLVLDEARRRALAGVRDGELSKVIGRGGTNVRLAGQLVGWMVEALANADLDRRIAQEDAEAAHDLAHALVLDEELALALVQEGLGDVASIAAAGAEELQLVFADLSEDMAMELWRRSVEAADQEALVNRLKEEERQAGIQSLLGLGIGSAHALILAEQGIGSAEDLAEQSVMDVLPWKGVDTETLGQWIMAARKSVWSIA